MPDHGPDRQNLCCSGKLSFFVIYKFWQNCASVRQVSDHILKIGPPSPLTGHSTWSINLAIKDLHTQLLIWTKGYFASWKGLKYPYLCSILEVTYVMNLNLSAAEARMILENQMAWCHQATSHYLSQSWPRSMLPYGVVRPLGQQI